MPENDSPEKEQKLTLYVCSGCEACEQAELFLRGWATGRSGVGSEIVTLAQRPDQVVRFGITYTPALVINDEFVSQDLSIETLAELLQTGLD